MKKLTVFAVAVLLLCLAAIGLAEAATETVVFSTERGKSIKVNKDAEAVDLGGVILSRQGNDFNNLVAFINQLPNLKKLDMYNTEVYASQVESLHAACPQVEFGWTMIIPCIPSAHPTGCVPIRRRFPPCTTTSVPCIQPGICRSCVSAAT